MNGYELSRKWFDFCFENPEKIKPNHTALYFFCVEHCNRLGWKEKFGLPTTMAKEAIGIRSYNTYINTLTDLVDWGFIKMIEKSKNQYSSNIIALSNFNKALDKALDKALIKHGTKQSESTEQSINSIDKPLTEEQTNNNGKYKAFIDWFNQSMIKVKGKEGNYKPLAAVKKSFEARLKDGYVFEDFEKAFNNIVADDYHKEQNYKYLTPKFLTNSEKLEKWANASDTKQDPRKTMDFSNYNEIGMRMAQYMKMGDATNEIEALKLLNHKHPEKFKFYAERHETYGCHYLDKEAARRGIKEVRELANQNSRARAN